MKGVVFKYLLSIGISCVLSLGAFGQFTSFMDFMTRPTTIQVGWHALDDDAKAFTGIFAVQKWSMLSYPTRISLTKTISSNFKADLSISYTKMKQSSYAVDRYLPPGNFYNADLNMRYQVPIPFTRLEQLYSPQAKGFRKFISNIGMNVFPMAGLGFTKRTQTKFANAVTLNIGVGGTFWFIKGLLGVSAQTMAKWGMQAPLFRAGSNYLHHSAGLVYVLNTTSKKGGNSFKGVVKRSGSNRARTTKKRF